MKILFTDIFSKKFFVPLAAFAILIFCVLACSSGSSADRKPESIQKRGDLTIEFYGAKPGLTHGDGTPSACSIVFKGERYFSPPIVKNGGRIFRCDLKPNSDEPVVWIAFYRPEDDWICGTRFGAGAAKCLPDSYESVGGLLTVKNNELALEELGFWDVSFDWTDTSVKFRDGREFNYKTWAWTGCGDSPLKFVKSAQVTIAEGQFCNSDDWFRVYFDGKEVLPDDAQNRRFNTAEISQNKDVPSVISWIGRLQMVIYLSHGKPVMKEMPNGGEYIEDGNFAHWWSEDYQTRYTMNLRTEETTQETRKEVQDKLEKMTAERNSIKQTKPILVADEYGKFEVDYQDKHNFFYMGALNRYSGFKPDGEFPHKVTSLLTTAKNGKVYFLFLVRNVYEMTNQKDICGGDLPLNLVWIQTDEKLYEKDAKSETISSCSRGRKQIGETQIDGDRLKIVFEEKGKKYEINYDNRNPENSFTVKEF